MLYIPAHLNGTFLMNLSVAIQLVSDLVLAERGDLLSEFEKLVLKAAWEDMTYDDIALQTGRASATYLHHDVGPKLWRFLNQHWGDGSQITKKRFRAFLERMAVPTAPQLERQVFGDNLPEVPLYFGYAEPLRQIQEWVYQQQCVVISGDLGTGKSALAARLVKELQKGIGSGFEYYIWKSVHYSPSLEDLLADLCQDLGLILDKEDGCEVFIRFLKSYRCLFVLDGAEAILKGNKHSKVSNQFGNYAGYATFFKRVVQESSSSCLVLTSREEIYDLNRLQTSGYSIASINLEGLEVKDAENLLAAMGLTGEQKWEWFIKTYNAYPLDLIENAQKIKRLFGGDVAKFFQFRSTLVHAESQAMLNQEFTSPEGLTSLQRHLLVALAESKDIKSNTFTHFFSILQMKRLEFTSSELMQALEILRSRSLIQLSIKPATDEAIYWLRPVYRKYILKDPLGLIHKSLQPA